MDLSAKPALKVAEVTKQPSVYSMNQEGRKLEESTHPEGQQEFWTEGAGGEGTQNIQEYSANTRSLLEPCRR